MIFIKIMTVINFAISLMSSVINHWVDIRYIISLLMCRLAVSGVSGEVAENKMNLN